MTGVEIWDQDEGVVVAINGAVQSFMNLKDPRDLRFGYARAMAQLIDWHFGAGGAGTVVHIGGAGMTLPRYVAATRSVRQIVVEPDAELTSQVLARAPLPPQVIEIVAETGEDWIRRARDSCAGAVLVDAFSAGSVPRALLTGSFLGEVRRILSESGFAAINVVDYPEARFARYVAALWASALGREVGVYPPGSAHFGNFVIAAAPRLPAHASALRGKEFADWLGDAADHDARPPEPPAATLGLSYSEEAGL